MGHAVIYIGLENVRHDIDIEASHTLIFLIANGQLQAVHVGSKNLSINGTVNSAIEQSNIDEGVGQLFVNLGMTNACSAILVTWVHVGGLLDSLVVGVIETGE